MVTQHTSKQYSCPKMLEWTGLIMASSSKTRSKASAALLGESRDSWEWDSLKLCIKRVLVREGFRYGSLLYHNHLLLYVMVFRLTIQKGFHKTKNKAPGNPHSCNFSMIFEI